MKTGQVARGRGRGRARCWSPSRSDRDALLLLADVPACGSARTQTRSHLLEPAGRGRARRQGGRVPARHGAPRPRTAPATPRSVMDRVFRDDSPECARAARLDARAAEGLGQRPSPSTRRRARPNPKLPLVNFLYGEALMKAEQRLGGAAAARSARSSRSTRNHFESNLLLGTLLREEGQTRGGAASGWSGRRGCAATTSPCSSRSAPPTLAVGEHDRGAPAARGGGGGRAGPPADPDAARGRSTRALGRTRPTPPARGRRRAAAEGGRLAGLPGRARVDQRPPRQVAGRPAAGSPETVTRPPRSLPVLGSTAALSGQRSPRPLSSPSALPRPPARSALAPPRAGGRPALAAAGAPSAVRGVVTVVGAKTNAGAVVTLEAPGSRPPRRSRSR